MGNVLLIAVVVAAAWLFVKKIPISSLLLPTNLRLTLSVKTSNGLPLFTTSISRKMTELTGWLDDNVYLLYDVTTKILSWRFKWSVINLSGTIPLSSGGGPAHPLYSGRVLGMDVVITAKVT